MIQNYWQALYGLKAHNRAKTSKRLQAVFCKKLLVMALLCLVHNTVSAALSDAIVAVVNDDVITQTELNARIGRVKNDISNSRAKQPKAGTASEQEIRKGVLKTMVEELVQVQLARKIGISITEQEIDRAIESVAQRNNITVREMQISMLGDQISFQAFRDEIRTNLMISRLVRANLTPRINVSEYEVNELLRQKNKKGPAQIEYNLSHILLKLAKDATPQEIELVSLKATALLAELEQGAGFSDIAKRASAAPDADQGGTLGWKKADQLPAVFVERLEDMKKGQLSGVIRSPGAFHILKLNDSRGNEVRVIEKRRAQHILIAAKTVVERQQAFKKLKELRSSVLDAEAFSQSAKGLSDDPGSAGKGGDLGWVTPGLTVPEFEQILFALAVNETSQPVVTQYGVHLIRLNEITTEDVSGQDQRDQAYEQLARRKTNQQYPAWLSDLVSNAYISYPE